MRNTARANLEGFRVVSGSTFNVITGNLIDSNGIGIHICASLAPPRNRIAPNVFVGHTVDVRVDTGC